MFETKLTMVGTVISEVRLTHTRTNEVPVANFSIATTARTFNKEKGGWVDGNSLQLRVSCWRRLGENVAASLHRGDPVLVSGNLYSRSYEASDGTRRWSYEVEATTVGPDLSRGTATFQRRPSPQAEQSAPATVLALGGADREVTTPQSEAA
jgi:single-strand DNA-binding protein